MELRQIQYMVACARTQSFSKAAELLFTTQSNVSKTIAALENELGQKLFDRKQRGITLTPKGRQVYQHALSMLECSSKIQECAEEECTEELHVSFQNSDWFAAAFCEFFIRHGGEGRRFYMNSAAVDEILRPLSGGLDQMGFACMEEEHIEKLRGFFRNNHIGFIVLKKAGTALHYGTNLSLKQRIEELLLRQAEGVDASEEAAERNVIEVPLIQGLDDEYSGLSFRKGKASSLKPKVLITTNSDFITREILARTELCTISPELPGHGDSPAGEDTLVLSEEEQNILYICMFRNDMELEALPKEFLTFIRQYMDAE
ncbi:MAG: LysR family transcriptional regulator [Clostridiales bacterium]|nr:LysR family transcriptional regulator [Candidatus Blautia equi]